MNLYQCYVTGTWWQCDNPVVTVVKDVSIPWNPDSETISISTNSEAGSWEASHVYFNDKDGNIAGAVGIYFDPQIKYAIDMCTYQTPFPATLPTETEKTWTITYNYTEKRVVYYCNGVQVVNFVQSDIACVKSSWREQWERKPTQIKFNSRENASDGYCIISNTGNYTGVIYSGE